MKPLASWLPNPSCCNTNDPRALCPRCRAALKELTDNMVDPNAILPVPQVDMPRPNPADDPYGGQCREGMLPLPRMSFSDPLPHSTDSGNSNEGQAVGLPLRR